MSASEPDRLGTSSTSDTPPSSKVADRRAFLKLAGRKAAYVAPAVATLAAASRANFAPAWSQ
ncbi:MAG: hypothetical protein AAF078_11685 [Planctomycetota bacterium]